ncbi:unnamed protein product, partial [Gongylonema pulchrum]|uniref:Non-structural maintenance of chromosomes element 1 homolog n=1 Tax=Gongylonema pulchrum TaxID=637853 RepID=A0A183EK47_9BILA
MCDFEKMKQVLHGFTYLYETSGKYGTAHKHLVQLITTLGIMQSHLFCLRFIQFVKAYQPQVEKDEQICITEKLPEKREKDLIASLIKTINIALAPIDLRLLQVDDEYDDDNDYVVLINDHQESDLLREASGFTTTDFSLFHLWINAICNSDSGEISKHDALSAASD